MVPPSPQENRNLEIERKITARFILIAIPLIFVLVQVIEFFLHRLGVHEWLEGIANGLLLVASLYPAFYFLLLKPLKNKQHEERRAAEETIHQSEQRYRNLINSIDGIVWEADYETDQTLFISNQSERILGYPAERWYQEPAFWNEHLHPGDRDLIQKSVRKQKHCDHLEYRMIAADGREVWLRDAVSVVEEKGRPVRYMGVSLDISKQREADHQFRTLVDSAKDVIYSLSHEGIIASLNPSFEAISGWKRKEWIGRHFIGLIHPEDAPLATEMFQRILEGEEVGIFELRILAKSGRALVAEFSPSPPIREGSSIKVLGIARDITERKEMEKTLAAQREQLQEQLAFAEARTQILSVIAHHDDPGTIFQRVSEIIGKLFQLEVILILQVDLEKDQIDALGVWADPERGIPISFGAPSLFPGTCGLLFEKGQPLESHADSVNPLLIEEGTAELLHEKLKIQSLLWFPLTSCCGRHYFIAMNQLTYRRKWPDEERSLLKVIASQLQIALQKSCMITARKEAEARLSESNELLERMFSLTHLHLVYLDREFNFIQVNRAYAEADEKAPEYYAGKNHFSLYPHEKNKAIFRKVVETGIPHYAFEKPFEYAENPERGVSYWDWSLIPVKKGDGSVSGVILSLFNVSERKRLSDQLRQSQKMDSIGALAGGVAHDFNNIMTAIRGFAELGLLNVPEEYPHQYFDEISKASLRAANLTRQLLLFSQQQPAAMEVLDLNRVISDFNKMLQRLVGEHYSIEATLSSILASVYADKGHIEQVIMNLVVNARDAMPEGGKILIRTQNIAIDENYCRKHIDARPGDFILLRVKDQGIGMDRQTVNRIFEPFFTTKGTKGTGLGLSVVYGIIRQHKGWLTVDSKPGKGSMFNVYLPALLKKAEEPVKRELQPPKTRLKGRVLLVEDEETVKTLAKAVLISHGMEVLSAKTFQEAIQLFEKESGRFDLVFSDVILPDGSGVALMDTLKKQNPKITVLLASGYGHERLHQAIQEQRYPLIQKPYGVQELLSVVQKYVKEF